MASASLSRAQETLDLSGTWQVSLDSMATFQSITLPGTTDAAGLGTPNSLEPALEKPQLLHLTRKHSFVGAAFYRRTVHIPRAMAHKPLTLTLERIIWQSRVWIDGAQLAGAEESLSTPHEYFLADGLTEGDHELLLCIDNRKRYDMSVQDMAHAYTNETQVVWNGVLGEMTLRAEAPVRFGAVSVYPDVANKRVSVSMQLIRTGKKKQKTQVSLQVGEESSADFPVEVARDTVIVERTLELGDDVELWDEFSPRLYTLRATCTTGKHADTQAVTFGLRELSASDGHLTVNGNRVFLRGTLECCIFPLTGTPPTDDAGWERVFAAAKAWGLNHLRFHSYCPPEAAFRVADRMGFYLQIELPCWSMAVGRDAKLNGFLRNEYDRITERYGNHPSFCLLSVGNELQPDFAFLNDFVGYMKSKDRRRLYTTSTFTFEPGHGKHPEPQDDFFVTQWTDRGWVRGQGVFDAEQPNFNKDYREAAEGIGVPLISHEIGQYSVYPNLREIDKYTGTLDPLNFKGVRRDLEKKGLADRADRFTEASGKLAVRLYKEEIERAMKTPQFSGFQLLGLQDFAGQGTALVGLVDAFWDSKGLCSEAAFRQWCAPVVPLARFEKATWTSRERFTASVEVANYYKENIDKPVVWRLTDKAGRTIGQGVMAQKALQKGAVTTLGRLSASLEQVRSASQLTLSVGIDGTDWKNEWPFWVYPADVEQVQTDVLVTQDAGEAFAALAKGRSVLLSPKTDAVEGLEGKFLPVFWSPVHFPKQAGTMGLLCRPDHPALAAFPTEMHSDWQWWNLVKRSRAVVIDSLPRLDPIVEVVDNFTNNRRLAAVFEAKVGTGRLIFSAMDLLSDNEKLPEVKQLLQSLLAYMSSDDFHPSVSVTPAAIRTLLRDGGKEQKSTDATSIYQ